MKKRKLSKNKWKSLCITLAFITILILLRYWLGLIINPEWDFMLNILNSTIGFAFLPMFYFIIRDIFNIRLIGG